MGPFAAIAAFVWLCLTLATCCWWILVPISRAARSSQLPTQFRIADLLCLVFLLQLPLACLRWAPRWAAASDESMIIGFGVLALFSLVLLWWFAVENLSRAGVCLASHRCIFQILVLPFVLVVAFLVGLLPFAMSASADRGGLRPGVLACALPLAVAALYVVGHFTKYILRAANPP
jgi:hypothetical protein